MRRAYDPFRARTMRDECYQQCHDCNKGAFLGAMESALRDGTYEWLCLDCYVASGDDNYHSCLEHDKERAMTDLEQRLRVLYGPGSRLSDEYMDLARAAARIGAEMEREACGAAKLDREYALNLFRKGMERGARNARQVIAQDLHRMVTRQATQSAAALVETLAAHVGRWDWTALKAIRARGGK